MITQSRLKELLNYNQNTGIFTWIVNKNRAHIGDIAGCSNSKGYIYIQINGYNFRAHRLAWLYVYGKFPDYEIDHIDRDRKNNRISNLRDINHNQNMQNTKIYSSNKSGYRGVSWNKTQCKWKVTVRYKQKHYHGGVFVNIDDAIESVKCLREKLFTHFND